MGRKDDRLRKRRGAFLFIAACILALGAVVLGAVVWASPGGLPSPTDLLASGDEPVRKVEEPAGNSAPKPAEKPAAEKAPAEKAEKPAAQKAGKQADKKGADKANGEKAGGSGSGEKAAGSANDAGTPSLASVPEPASTEMYLTVPKMGKVNEPVGEGVDPATLYNGPGHAPGTGYPWQPNSNTYIAGHVLGYAGTGSYLDFAELPNMTYGDEIVLTDANGTTYRYVVSEILQVSIYDTWVLGPTGKTQVTLQTCINPPAYDVRLVVRGDLVDVQRA